MDIDQILRSAQAELKATHSKDIGELDALLDKMQSDEPPKNSAPIEQQIKEALSGKPTTSYADLDSVPYEPDLSPSSIYDPDVLAFQQSILDNAETEQVLVATPEINISTIQVGASPVVIEQTPVAKLAITSANVDTILEFALGEVAKIQSDAVLDQDNSPANGMDLPVTPEISEEEVKEVLATSSTPAKDEPPQADPILEKIEMIRDSFDKVTIPIDRITLDDSYTFKSEAGIDLVKFPKQYARISTNIQKQAEWYSMSLEQHGEAGLQAIAVINEIKQSDVSLDAIQMVGNNVLFGNPFGPLQKHRQLTKDELKALAIAEENARRERLVQEAIERAAQSESPEDQAKRDKFREIISEIKSLDVMSAETARMNDILQSNRLVKAKDMASGITDEVPEKANVTYTAPQQVEEENSYYAIVSNDKVIATGLANNFPPSLLTTMAKEANGYLLWSAKPFEIDLGLFKVKGLEQTQSQEVTNTDKFEAEVSKGLEKVQSNYLEIHPPTHKTSELVQVGIDANVNHAVEASPTRVAAAEMNENIRMRIAGLVALAEEKNRTVKFYQHKNDANSVLVVSGEGDKMKFATIAKNGNLMKLAETFDRKTFASLLAKSNILELNVQDHIEQNLSSSGLAP